MRRYEESLADAFGLSINLSYLQESFDEEDKDTEQQELNQLVHRVKSVKKRVETSQDDFNKQKIKATELLMKKENLHE